MKKLILFIGLVLVAIAAFTWDMTVLQIGLLTIAEVPFLGNFGNQEVIKGLKEDMGKAHRQICELDELASKEKRSLTPDEENRRTALIGEFEAAKEKRKRLEDSEERSRQMKEIDDEFAENRKNGESRDEYKENYSKAFRKYMLSGMESLGHEERDILRAGEDVENRNLSKGTTTSGGYTVPQGFQNKIDVALKMYGGVMELGNILETATGKDIPWPTVNDTSNIGELLAEAASIGNSVDPTFGLVTLKAYKFSSKKLLVSPELLDDNEVDLESILAVMIGERLGRVINNYGTLGTGTNQPQGFVVGAANSSITGVTGTAITFENLIDLLHSVDPAYRKNGRWAFNDSTLKALRKIKDSENRYIWQPGLTSEAPAQILGSPYQINQDMASIGLSAKSVVFGDFSKFKIRVVAGYRFRRLLELNADTDQVGYIAFKRVDTRLIDAGMNPIKYLQHAAS